MRKVNLPNEFGFLVTKLWVCHATFLWWHGLSQPALFWTAFIQILDGHLKMTAFGRLLMSFGLLINFMMASYNLSLVQYSWRPQLAKQSLYKIFPLPFNVSYFLDNRYKQCQCVQYIQYTALIHTQGNQNKLTPDNLLENV